MSLTINIDLLHILKINQQPTLTITYIATHYIIGSQYNIWSKQNVDYMKNKQDIERYTFQHISLWGYRK